MFSGQPDFSDEECAAAVRVLRSGWVGPGPEVDAFEEELANYVGAQRVVTVSSCTAALTLSLKVLGVGQGDEVICPSLTWVADASAILSLGARPVFCDVDQTTFSASVETVLPHVSEKTKAVVLVHYGGLASSPQPIRDALPPHIAIVEDAAHALGAKYPDGNAVGSSGNLTCFSFYANKNLSTVDGGAIALESTSQADRLALLRQHGVSTTAIQRININADRTTEIVEPGYKMSYSDLSAAIGRVQLRRQAEFDTHRRKLARSYVGQTENVGLNLQFQDNVLASGHARHLIAALLPHSGDFELRNAVRRHLKSRGIHAGVHYDALHRQGALSGSADLPTTDDLARRLLSLPIGPRVTVDQTVDCVDEIADAIQSILEEKQIEA